MLVGPSGSGKSTALRMLAGLEDVDLGEIRIGDRDVSNAAERPRHRDGVPELRAVPAHDRRREHGLRAEAQGRQQGERDAKVREAAKLLDLERYLDRKPKALSGGQRQRVAMGRAIVREPQVFLMDEPLSNLDAKLRVETRANIAALQARLGTTTLYVTHDQVEAMTMGHRVAVLKDGAPAAGRHAAQPVRPPEQRVRRRLHRLAGNEPAPATLVPGGAQARQHRHAAARRRRGGGQEAGLKKVILGVRPESFHVGATADSGLEIKVNLVEELGADAYIYGELTGDPEVYEKQYIVRSTFDPIVTSWRPRTSPAGEKKSGIESLRPSGWRGNVQRTISCSAFVDARSGRCRPDGPWK